MSKSPEARKRKRQRVNKRKAERRQSAPEALAGIGATFDVKNNGAHILIRTEHGRIDFWPGTEKWVIDLDHSNTHKGLDALVAMLTNGEAPTPDSEWGACLSCEREDFLVPRVGMCGPCTFGEASTIGGNW